MPFSPLALDILSVDFIPKFTSDFFCSFIFNHKNIIFFSKTHVPNNQYNFFGDIVYKILFSPLALDIFSVDFIPKVTSDIFFVGLFVLFFCFVDIGLFVHEKGEC